MTASHHTATLCPRRSSTSDSLAVVAGWSDEGTFSIARSGSCWLGIPPGRMTTSCPLRAVIFPEDPMTTTKTTKSQDAATAAVIEKALDSLMKSAGTAYQRSYGLFSAGLEVFKTANPDKGINDFVDTDEGAALKAAHDETRQRFYFDGPVDAYAAPAIETLQTLDAEIAKQVEAFSITHDLDPLASRARLEMISPTFADLQKRHAAADAERRASVDNARAYAKRWHDEQAMRAEQDEADRVAKAKLAKLKPSERAFEKRVGEIMKSRSLDRQKAIVWGADNDPALQSLYAVIREEKGLA